MTQQYTSDYFQSYLEEVKKSAEAIVPIVMSLIRPESVVDVGCGTGIWLSRFKEHGVNQVLGIDGDYLDRNILELPNEEFRTVNLSHPFELERTFDLTVCLEVAEHLPPESAETFVHCLSKLSPVILFSAAIPFQGGVHHVNEQWPEYWVKYFTDLGFLVWDCVRAKIWKNTSVEYWYAQNILLFIQRDHLKRSPSLWKKWKNWREAPLSIIHPRHYLDLGKKHAKAVTDYEFYSAKAEKLEAEAERHRAESHDTRIRAENYLADAERYRADIERYRSDLERYVAELTFLKAELERYRTATKAKRTQAELTSDLLGQRKGPSLTKSSFQKENRKPDGSRHKGLGRKQNG